MKAAATVAVKAVAKDAVAVASATARVMQLPARAPQTAWAKAAVAAVVNGATGQTGAKAVTAARWKDVKAAKDVRAAKAVRHATSAKAGSAVRAVKVGKAVRAGAIAPRAKHAAKAGVAATGVSHGATRRLCPWKGCRKTP